MPGRDVARLITERQRVLHAWERAVRPLSTDLRTTFLGRWKTLDALAAFTDEELTAAAGVARRGDVLRLDHWLGAARNARAAGSTTAAPTRRAAVPRAASGRRRGDDRLRSADGLVPQRPVDWRLAKRIGPIQNYRDDS